MSWLAEDKSPAWPYPAVPEGAPWHTDGPALGQQGAQGLHDTARQAVLAAKRNAMLRQPMTIEAADGRGPQGQTHIDRHHDPGNPEGTDPIAAGLLGAWPALGTLAVVVEPVHRLERARLPVLLARASHRG